MPVCSDRGKQYLLASLARDTNDLHKVSDPLPGNPVSIVTVSYVEKEKTQGEGHVLDKKNEEDQANKVNRWKKSKKVTKIVTK